MKILIVTPSFSLLGGVANHFSGLRDYWQCSVEHVYYGKRKRIPALIMLPIDWTIFLIKLLFRRPDFVLINPSLRRYQITRDAVYLITARVLRIKTLCFFHGWDEQLASKLERNPRLFKSIYNKSSLILVLASQFRNSLIKMGFSCPIELTTTKVNDKLVEGFSIENSKQSRVKEILFLARIIKPKGIYIAIDAFKILLKNDPDLKFRVVGDGPELENVKKYVLNQNIENIIFTGALSGDSLKQQFENTQLSVLPSSSEGMPTSILESMAFGMPIVTSPVGGLIDFFENGKMGFLVQNLDAKSYAKAMQKIINDQELFSTISTYNFHYAHNRFLASKVATELENKIKILSNH